ncbi:MAG TPA: TonB-dependent receptor [Sphingobium sp.]
MMFSRIGALKTGAALRVMAALSVSALPLAAEAQDVSPPASGAPQAAENDVGVTDIVVTAQKRSESAQRLPAAVSVMTSEVLTARGVVDMKGMENLLPSAKLNIENSAIQVFIRGVGSQLDFTWIPASVGVNLDGGALCRYCAAGAFYDVQRVEILPGPQGTLYGSSAVGGVVNILTNKPTKDLSTEATLEYGNYNTTHATLVQNIPVTNNWGIRGAVDYYDNDGFNNNGTYDQHSISARLSSLYESGDFSAFLTGSYFHNRSRPSPTQYAPFPAQGAYYFPDTEVATAFFYPPNGLRYDAARAVDENYIGSGQFDLTLGGVTISYIPSGLYVTRTDDRNVAGFIQTFDAKIKQYSNELRLSGDSGGLKWIAGLYQLWNHSQQSRVFGPNFAGEYVDSHNESVAAYGQATYSVTDAARITVGARISKDKLRADNSEVIFPTATFGRGTIPFIYRNSWDKFGWKVGAEYDVTRDSMLYAAVQTGFNPGTFRTSVGTEGTTVDPQTMLGYTAGIKNRFLDGRLRLNVEGFYYDYKKLPVNAIDFATGILTTLNAPKVHIKGIQADLAAAPVHGLDLNAGLGYLDAKFKEFTAGAAGAEVNYAGFPLPYAPKFTATLGAQYSYELGGSASVKARVDTYISSAYWDIFTQTSNLRQGSYSKTDVSLTYFAASGKWDIGAYGKNLENTASHAASGETGRPFPFAGAVYVEAPRQYGVRLHVTL